MAKIRFKGFADDSAVSLSATAGGVTKGPLSISAWRQPPSPSSDVGTMTLTIHRSPGARFAPEAIYFEAEAQGTTGLQFLNPDGTAIDGLNRDGTTNANALYTYYDPQFHELEFEWETSQTGEFPLAGRLPPWMRAKNIAHGKHMSHVFETAGAHWVRCSVYRTDYANGLQSSVLVARKTEQITVATLEAVIPEANRLYISTIVNDPDFASLPAGVQTAHTTGSLFQSGAPSHFSSGTGPKAVFLKRGQNYRQDGSGWATNAADAYWGSWGTGALPMIDNDNLGTDAEMFLIGTPNEGSSSLRTFTVHNLEFRGKWDDVNEVRLEGQPNTIRKEFGIRIVAPAWSQITACKFSRLDTCISHKGGAALSNAPNLAFIVWNNEIEQWRDYGVFMSDECWGALVAMVGNRFRPSPDAGGRELNGDTTKSFNSHSPIRTPSHWRLYVAQNDAVSRFGWGGSTQPCYRLSTESWGYYPAGRAEPPRILAWGNLAEGGAVSFAIGVAGDDHPSLSVKRTAWPFNCLAKHNICLAGWDTSGAFGVNNGGASVVENVLIFSQVMPIVFRTQTHDLGEKPDATNFSSFAPLLDRNIDPPLITENEKHPIRHFGNVIIDNRTVDDPAQVSEIRAPDNLLPDDFKGWIDHRDNYIYRPNGTQADASAGPMELAHAFINAIIVGPRVDWTGNGGYITYDTLNGDGTGVSLVAASGDLDLLRPASGAAVIGTATGPLGRVDLMGNERPANASAGALEPRI